MNAEPFVLLDDAEKARLLRFSRPRAVLCAAEPGEVGAVLAAAEQARADGWFLAGYLSYEAGLVLEPRLRPLLPARRGVPLVWLGVFAPPEVLEGAAAEAVLAGLQVGRAYAGPLVHEWSEGDYAKRFARAHGYIGAGDIYQVNLTFRSRFAFAGDPVALYRRLRAVSDAPHGAFVFDGARHVLSLSPELFFAADGQGRIVSRPMKGTVARGADPHADAAAKDWLAASIKDRAENLMIVDLIRNDLGRVAEIGSVGVDALFAIETYPSVHQMVSQVSARLRPDAGLAAILSALFPCGSITGAPKIRAMEIAHELEGSARGVYCGAIGHFAPDGTASFNVAIRTLTLEQGRGELGIGGGVVHDSSAPGEYAECLVKARYYDMAREPIGLIETLRHDCEVGFVRLARHLARLRGSAAAFGLPYDEEAAIAALKAVAGGQGAPLRVRLTLDEGGQFAASAAPLGPAPGHWRYALAAARVQSTDPLLAHKTSWRSLHDGAWAGRPEGSDEVLILNERGEIAEGSRTNLFVELDGALYTPPLTSGVLPGCLRAEMIDDGRCRERVLRPEDLSRASRVYLGNSLRGLIPAEPI